MNIFEIPQKLRVTWNAEVRAIIDTWSSYMISTEEFKTAVLLKGLTFAKANNGQAWIVDSSKAKGVFSHDQQTFINDEVFPAFRQNGIKYFITIKPESSSFTEMTVKKYSANADQRGLQLVEVKSVEQAIMWLKNQR